MSLVKNNQLVYNKIKLVDGGNMQSLGAFQVKTHLSQLLKEVEETGEIVAITRHGKTVALLVPATKENPIQDAIRSIRKNRIGVKLGNDLLIKNLIKEGRR